MSRVGLKMRRVSQGIRLLPVFHGVDGIREKRNTIVPKNGRDAPAQERGLHFTESINDGDMKFLRSPYYVDRVLFERELTNSISVVLCILFHSTHITSFLKDVLRQKDIR